MTTLVFDTLKLARNLEAAGFPAKQAADTAAAVAASLGEVEGLATKADIDRLGLRVDAVEERIDRRIDAVANRIGSRIDAVENLVTVRLIKWLL